MSSDGSSDSIDDIDVKPSKKAVSGKNTSPKNLKNDSSVEEKQLVNKKKRKSSKQEEGSSAAKKTKQCVKSAEGEDMVEFGLKRFVSVTEFKGNKMVNIREYYEKNGQWLPSKKGISMKLDQWKQFKEIIPDIDELIMKGAD